MATALPAILLLQVSASRGRSDWFNQLTGAIRSHYIPALVSVTGLLVESEMRLRHRSTDVGARGCENGIENKPGGSPFLAEQDVPRDPKTRSCLKGQVLLLLWTNEILFINKDRREPKGPSYYHNPLWREVFYIAYTDVWYLQPTWVCAGAPPHRSRQKTPMDPRYD